MNLLKKLTFLSILLASLTMLTACEKNNAETAGEKIDEMVTDAGNAVEDACEEAKEGMKAEDKDC